MLGACGDEPAAPPQAAQVVQVVDGGTVVLAGGIKGQGLASMPRR